MIALVLGDLIVRTRVNLLKANQLNLFAGIAIPRSANRSKSLSMDADALAEWKIKISAHQQRAKENQPVQGTLFNVTKAHVDPDKIDPFNLRQCLFIAHERIPQVRRVYILW